MTSVVFVIFQTDCVTVYRHGVVLQPSHCQICVSTWNGCRQAEVLQHAMLEHIGLSLLCGNKVTSVKVVWPHDSQIGAFECRNQGFKVGEHMSA